MHVEFMFLVIFKTLRSKEIVCKCLTKTNCLNDIYIYIYIYIYILMPLVTEITHFIFDKLFNK